MLHQHEQEIKNKLKQEAKEAILKSIDNFPNLSDEDKQYTEDIFCSTLLSFGDIMEVMNKIFKYADSMEVYGWDSTYSQNFKNEDGIVFTVNGCGYDGSMNISQGLDYEDYGWRENYNYRKE